MGGVDRCLICYANLTEEEQQVVQEASPISQHVQAIFIFGKLLEIPQDALTGFLEKRGEHPGEWVRLCSDCGQVVDNAKRTFDEMTQIQRRFRKVQEDIQEKVQNQTEYRSERSIDQTLSVTDECRDIVQQRDAIKKWPDPTQETAPWQEDEHMQEVMEMDESNEELIVPSPEESLSDLESAIVLNSVRSKALKAFVCPLCLKFKRKTVKGVELCEHLDSCAKKNPNSQNILLSCPTCQTFQVALSEKAEFMGHVAHCRGYLITNIPLQGRIFHCSVCAKADYNKYFKLDTFMEHYRHHKRYPFRCSRCPHRFLSKNSSDNKYHFSTRHPEYYHPPSERTVSDPDMPAVFWWCPVCGLKCPNEVEREEHVRNLHFQVEVRRWKCEKCLLETYFSAEELQLHETMVHNEKKSDSASTGYSREKFEEIVSQESELLTWTGKLFGCTVCGTGDNMNLIQFLEHYLRHIKYRFKCANCDHGFRTSRYEDTRYHYKICHPQIPVGSPKAILQPLPEVHWTCPYCPDLFNMEDERDSHVSQIHQKGKIQENLHLVHQCSFCNNAYSCWGELRLHELTRHVYDTHKGLNLQVSANERDNSLVAARVRPISKTKKRKKCSKVSDKKDEIRHSPSSRKKISKNSIDTKTTVERAVDETPDVSQTCPDCGMSFRTQVGLALHVKLHEKDLFCPLCREFTTRLGSALCTHLDSCPKKSTDEEVFLKCQNCNVFTISFENKVDYCHHVLCCREMNKELRSAYFPALVDRIFECSICTQPKRYLTLDRFLEHYLYHFKFRYKCSECGVLQPSEKSTNLHFVKNHDESLERVPPEKRFLLNESFAPNVPWWCRFCNAVFTDDVLRNEHVSLEHPTEQPEFNQQCSKCPKKYETVTELKIHENTAHVTKDTCFTCPLCSKSFDKQSQLINHKKYMHAKTRDRVVCDICGMDMLARSLTHHLEMHKKLRKFACDHPNCTESFATPYYLKLHRLREHADRDHTQNPLVCLHCPDGKTVNSAQCLSQVTHSNGALQETRPGL